METNTTENEDNENIINGINLEDTDNAEDDLEDDEGEIKANYFLDSCIDAVHRMGPFFDDTENTFKEFTEFLSCSNYIDVESSEGFTMLLILTQAENPHEIVYRIISLLLENGCTMEKKDPLDQTAIFYAISFKNPKIMKMLLDRGCSLNGQTKNGYGILKLVIEQTDKNEEIFDLIVSQKGLNCNIQDKNGDTCLVTSLKTNFPYAAKKLIEKFSSEGIEYISDNKYLRPIHHSIIVNNIEIAKLLISMNNQFDMSSPQYLNHKIHNIHGDLILNKFESWILFSCLCDICKEPIENQIESTYSCKECMFMAHAECLNIVSFRDCDGNTPLFFATSKESVSLLIKNGAYVNQLNKFNSTPLHAAIFANNSMVAHALIDAGADIRRRNKENLTPLQLCSKSTDVGIIRRLLFLDFPFTSENKIISVLVDNYNIAEPRYNLGDKIEVLTSHQIGEIINIFGEEALIRYGDVLFRTFDSGSRKVKEKIPLDDLKLISSSRAPQYQSWSIFMDSNLPIEIKNRIDIIREVLTRKFFGIEPAIIARTIAFTKDEQDREIFFITDSKTREVLKDELYLCSRYELEETAPLHISATCVVVRAMDHGIYKQAFKDTLENSKSVELNLDMFVESISKIGLNFKREELQKEFVSADKDSSGYMSEYEFVKFCECKFGQSQKVVLKFMRNIEEYQREIFIRKQKNLDPKYVIGLLPSHDIDSFKAKVKIFKISTGNGEFIDMSPYPYALVMSLADRSLQDIFEKERPDDVRIRLSILDVVENIMYLHENNLVHGDIKALNILRIKDRLRIIDMDAATFLGNPIGAKFSSGTLGPEMFCKLDNKGIMDYEKYWENEKNANSELWMKIRPRGNIVIKTFRTSSKEDGKILQTLPYSLEIASEFYDIWALGLLLFKMCSISKTSLLETNRDDDIKDKDYVRAMSWTDSEIKTEIDNEIENKNAADLILKLLRVNPRRRIKLIDVLKHPYLDLKSLGESTGRRYTRFFQQILSTQSESLTILKEVKSDTTEIRKITEETLKEIVKTRNTLLNAVFDSNEVSVPTSFIVLPVNLAHEDLASKESINVHRAKEIESFMVKMFSISKKISAAISEGASSALVKTGFDQLTAGSKLYFYLVDEITGLPVVKDNDKIYPIEIETKSEKYNAFMEKNFHLIQGGFKLIKGLNSVAGLFSSLGVPTLGSESVARVGEFVENLNKKSSVEEWDVIQTKIDDKDEQAKAIKNLRGARLRDLISFFEDKDKSKKFSGLRRTYTIDGHAIWTSLEQAENMENLNQTTDKDHHQSKNPPSSPKLNENDKSQAKSFQTKSSSVIITTEKEEHYESFENQDKVLDKLEKLMKQNKKLENLLEKQSIQFEKILSKGVVSHSATSTHLDPPIPLLPPSYSIPSLLPDLSSSSSPLQIAHRKLNTIKSKVRDLNFCKTFKDGKYEDVFLYVSNDFLHLYIMKYDENIHQIELCQVSHLEKELSSGGGGVDMKASKWSFGNKSTKNDFLICFVMEEGFHSHNHFIIFFKNEERRDVWFERYKILIEYMKLVKEE